MAQNNEINYRSLHPFQLIWNGEKVFMQRGLVFDVNRAKPFEVEGATKDLRFEQPGTEFNVGVDIYARLETDDPSTVNEGESVDVLSASASLEPGSFSVKIGSVSPEGVIDQKIRSDIYIFIEGQKTV